MIPNLLTLKAKLIALGISFAAGAIITGGAAYSWHNDRVDSLRLKWEEEKKAAVKAGIDAAEDICDENNKTTKEKAHALQSRLNSISDMYVGLLSSARSNPGKPAAPGPAGGGNDPSRGDLPALQVPVLDGLRSAKLADDQAARLIILQDTVADIYCRAGQKDLLPAEYQAACK